MEAETITVSWEKLIPDKIIRVGEYMPYPISDFYVREHRAMERCESDVFYLLINDVEFASVGRFFNADANAFQDLTRVRFFEVIGDSGALFLNRVVGNARVSIRIKYTRPSYMSSDLVVDVPIENVYASCFTSEAEPEAEAEVKVDDTSQLVFCENHASASYVLRNLKFSEGMLIWEDIDTVDKGILRELLPFYTTMSKGSAVKFRVREADYPFVIAYEKWAGNVVPNTSGRDEDEVQFLIFCRGNNLADLWRLFLAKLKALCKAGELLEHAYEIEKEYEAIDGIEEDKIPKTTFALVLGEEYKCGLAKHYGSGYCIW